MKKNVLFINGHLNAGGCERSLVDVLKHFDYEKYNVDLLLLEELGDYYAELPKSVNVFLYSICNAFGDIKSCMKNVFKHKDLFSLFFRIILFISSKWGKDKLKYMSILLKKLKREYDVIIAYRPGFCTDLAAYTLKAKKKISWWHHGEMHYSGKQLCDLCEVYKRMDTIVAVSECSAELLIKSFPEVKEKIIVIPNMICPEELNAKAEQYRIPYQCDSGRKKLVSVGRMSPEKNMLILPQIGKWLKDQGMSFVWFIIGDGIDFKGIEEKIHDFHLEEDFIMTGRLENPYPYIKNADILVHPSLVESQGITVLEAMALGTPVVVMRSLGPLEFIENKKNGVLVKDEREMFNMSKQLLNNQALLTEMVIQAERSVKRFTPDYTMNRLHVLLER